MRYIMSDIHGCYEEYRELLEKINFSDADELYVLGDAMDRGPEPIKVVQDIMDRPNVFYILGNHDAEFMSLIRDLAKEVASGNTEQLSTETMRSYRHWMEDGGGVTVRQFLSLSGQEQEDLLAYLEEAAPYEMLEEKGCLYILVHAGIENFSPDRELDEYAPTDFLWERADYGKRYYSSDRIFLVTGHTPTPLIRADKKPLVYCGNGHIAIDCGCVFGGQLTAYCIETGQTTYVQSKKKKANA